VQEEWKNADEVCTQILSAGGPVANWDRLLEPFPFFTAFRNYLQVRHAPAVLAAATLSSDLSNTSQCIHQIHRPIAKGLEFPRPLLATEGLHCCAS
jgi:hypothetical protein